MNCNDARPFVDASLDGELELARQLQIEAHLAECPACARVFDARATLRSALRTNGLYFRAPARLSRRIRRAISPQLFFHVQWPGWRAVAAAAAIVVLVASAALVVFRSGHTETDLLAQEIVSSHVRSLLPGHLTDVVSSDQHTVKPWFAGKVDFSPPVPDLREQGFPLVGGRLDYVGGRTVAALVYERHKHVLNVFVWPSSAESPQQSGRIHGYNFVRWSRAGGACWVVSDLNTTELQQFVRLLEERTAS